MGRAFEFKREENETLVSNGKAFTRIGKDIVMAVRKVDQT
jgi:hypothetical protein